MKKEPQDIPSNNLQTASPIPGNACKGEHQRQGICSLSNQPTQVTDTNYEDTCASHSRECSAKVQVGPYTVKSSAALTLQAIMKKHGDIGKDCLFESVYMRTLAVEGICKVVQELEMTKLLEVDKSIISAYYSVVRDAQRMKLNVKWLHDRLGEIYEAVQVLECNTELVNEEKQRVQSIEKMKKKLQSDRATLEELRSNIEKQESALAMETQLTEKLVDKIKDLTPKFQHLHKSLVDGLL